MLNVKEAEAFLKAGGEERISVAELDRRLADLGYKRESGPGCVGSCRDMNTGFVYTGINYGVVEIDTGMRFCHVDARRDSRFKELQAMRQRVFCVVRGRILTV